MTTADVIFQGLALGALAASVAAVVAVGLYLTVEAIWNGH